MILLITVSWKLPHFTAELQSVSCTIVRTLALHHLQEKMLKTSVLPRRKEISSSVLFYDQPFISSAPLSNTSLQVCLWRWWSMGTSTQQMTKSLQSPGSYLSRPTSSARRRRATLLDDVSNVNYNRSSQVKMGSKLFLAK